MITNFKTYESINRSKVILVTEPDSGYRKFTYGKQYELYQSSSIRTRDDNGKFDTLYYNEPDEKRSRKNIITYKNNAGYLFTTDKNIEAYHKRKTTERFDL